MEKMIQTIVQSQKQFFRSGKTMDPAWRKDQLIRLKIAVQTHQKEMEEALYKDLGRHETEAWFCDIGTIILEVNEMIRGLNKWNRPEIHYSGMHCFPSMITKVYAVPYGVTLIISPFNFPFLLALGAAAAAMTAGNTVVIKASSKSVHCTEVLQRMIADTFPPEYFTVISGGHDVADLCLKQPFDKIFYTGSPAVGRHVLHMAADNLTSVALELGGETGNWCVVRRDADLRDAARKIAFLKLCNSGQICININQIAVDEQIAEEFLSLLKQEFVRQITDDPLNNEEYPCLITSAAYEKCAKEADQYRDRIIFGGHGDAEKKKYEPTIIWPVSKDESIVQHELFSPLLPVVSYRDEEIADLLDTIAEREHGLAFYLFTKDIREGEKIMRSLQFGGGCINEVCLHMMVKGVPFNGTGHSGMGAYHGIWGFREFTHPCTVLFGSSKFNMPLREHPYGGKKNAWKKAMVKLFER
ncbi:MAG: aldehyde dehydrogenase family protein [Solobacterium sp.]|nr:aldehyde dehydrogenase family protein [Solobacterium sp.]